MPSIGGMLEPPTEDKKEEDKKEQDKKEQDDENPEGSFTVLNGLPMMKEGYVFDRRYQIFERSGWDDSVGATYFAIDLRKNKEVVLRIEDDRKAASTVKVESTFLKKVEDARVDSFFLQVVSRGVYKGFCYVATYFKGGPSLEDCMKFMKNRGGKFSHGSAGRMARDILKILEKAHGLGYLIRSLHPNMVFFDACSRMLFLSDLTTVQKDAAKLKLSVKNRWAGSLQYAPMSHHRGDGLTCRDEVEAMLFILAEMVTGSLPWESADSKSVEDLKSKALKQGTLFSGLPSQYAKLLEEVNKTKAGSEVNYNRLGEIIKDIYEEAGGVKSSEDNYDFEREPTDEETPKFVLEKVPKESNGAGILTERGEIFEVRGGDDGNDEDGQRSNREGAQIQAEAIHRAHVQIRRRLITVLQGTLHCSLPYYII